MQKNKILTGFSKEKSIAYARSLYQSSLPPLIILFKIFFLIFIVLTISTMIYWAIIQYWLVGFHPYKEIADSEFPVHLEGYLINKPPKDIKLEIIENSIYIKQNLENDKNICPHELSGIVRIGINLNFKPSEAESFATAAYAFMVKTHTLQNESDIPSSTLYTKTQYSPRTDTKSDYYSYKFKEPKLRLAKLGCIEYFMGSNSNYHGYCGMNNYWVNDTRIWYRYAYNNKKCFWQIHNAIKKTINYILVKEK